MDNFENKTPEQEPEKTPEQEKTPKGAPQTEPQKVYYRPSQFGQQQQQNQNQQQNQYQQQNYQQRPQYQQPNQQFVPQGGYQPMQAKKGMPSWLKVLLIVALVLVIIVYLLGSCVAKIGSAFNTALENPLMETGTDVTVADADGEYIGVIHIEDTISEAGASSAYNHQYILQSLRDMAKDDNNKGVILYMNTPGGSVFASDEVYFAIKDYQSKTGRPVYSSMQSMCASGGYYISAPCDKIYANRNTLTGSIGVTMGTMYDLSGLLDKLGIKTRTITAGDNKAMGSSTEEMTEEQYEIFKSVADEAYDQFTGIVAEGRNMDIKDVKKLADGRIYTAKQALENGLIDEIGTYSECVNAMRKDYSLGADCTTLDFYSSDEMDLRSYLGFSAEDLKGMGVLSADQIKELTSLNGSFCLMYKFNG